MAQPTHPSNLEEIVSHTEFKSNPFADEIHPERSPVEFAPVDGFDEAYSLFRERIENIVEGDYGDFMRRAQTYFLEFLSEIGTPPNALQARIRWIEEYLQFRPNWDIESTRARLLVDIEQLKSELTHSQSFLSTPSS